MSEGRALQPAVADAVRRRLKRRRLPAWSCVRMYGGTGGKRMHCHGCQPRRCALFF